MHKSEKVEQVAIDELIPYVNNSRTHPEKQIEQIASSIREFGFTAPILCDEKGTVLAGHGRLLAAKKLKLDRVPVVRVEHLSEAQKKAYVIADNKIAMNSGWDLDLLNVELDFLKEQSFDTSLLGFSLDELDEIQALIEPEEEVGEDDSEKIRQEWEILVTLGTKSEMSNFLQECKDRGLDCATL